MTLSKLAQLANVSVSVVSKAFSGRPDISDAMREHVFAVAREHGCFHQFYHVPYDKPVIAVIVPEVISNYYIRYIQSLGKQFEQKGYTMLLSISNFDRRLTSELVRYYTEHGKVDGLLLLSHPNELPQSLSCTTVAMFDCDALPSVHQDLSSGLRDALAALKECGHTRVGYVGEELTRSKQQLFVQLAAELGLEARPEWVICSRHRFEEAGLDGMRRILAAPERPSAVFGAYSYITRGVIKGLRNAGVRLPKDVSVISMDSDGGALDLLVRIAHITTGIDACCEAAVSLIAKRMQNNSTPPEKILIPTEFDAGDSIAIK